MSEVSYGLVSSFPSFFQFPTFSLFNSLSLSFFLHSNHHSSQLLHTPITTLQLAHPRPRPCPCLTVPCVLSYPVPVPVPVVLVRSTHIHPPTPLSTKHRSKHNRYASIGCLCLWVRKQQLLSFRSKDSLPHYLMSLMLITSLWMDISTLASTSAS
jgi:hypothetical protein